MRLNFTRVRMGSHLNLQIEMDRQSRPPSEHDIAYPVSLIDKRSIDYRPNMMLSNNWPVGLADLERIVRKGRK